MPKARPFYSGLNGGEVDRETVARSDVESYANKSEVFENALPALKGGMFRAPGTYWLGYTIDAAGEDLAAALRTWRFSRAQAFTLELSAGRIRPMFGTGFVQVGSGAGVFDAGGWDDDSEGGATTAAAEPDWPEPPTIDPGSGSGGSGGSGGAGGGDGYDPPEDNPHGGQSPN